MSMTIFLVGMPGSGKSTIGKALAEHLQYPFYDTDDIIAGFEEMSVNSIFETKGEPYFRELEYTLIRDWKLTHVVVATRGGLPCDHDLMEALQNKGHCVWIQETIPTIVARIKMDDSRPLLKEKSDAVIRKILSTMLQTRKPYYQQAKVKVKCQPEIQDTVKKILQ